MAGAKRACTFDGCRNALRSKGLCTGHLGQIARGDSLRQLRPMARRGESTKERLARFTKKTDTCWLWIGSRNRQGYGKINLNQGSSLAHRAMYELHNGPVDPELVVDHICRNRACVRPDHLQAVTAKENNENLDRAGRGASGVRGVCWDSRTGSWLGQVGHGGKNYFIGRYGSIAEAEAAVVEARNLLHTNNLTDRGAKQA